MLQDLIIRIRDARKQQKIEPKIKIDIELSDYLVDLYKENQHIIKQLANIGNIQFKEKKSKKEVDKLIASPAIFKIININIDQAKEKARLTKEVEALKKYLTGLDKKLSNKEFVVNAPKEIVAKEKEKQAEANDKLGKLKEQLKQLK